MKVLVAVRQYGADTHDDDDDDADDTNDDTDGDGGDDDDNDNDGDDDLFGMTLYWPFWYNILLFLLV